MPALNLKFYADALLTEELPSLNVLGREGRFVDNHVAVYLGSPDPTIKWEDASGYGAITLEATFDYDRWYLEKGTYNTPSLANASLLLCLDGDYTPDDEGCFSSYVYIEGDIEGGLPNAIKFWVALSSWDAGELDYFCFRTGLVEELEIP